MGESKTGIVDKRIVKLTAFFVLGMIIVAAVILLQMKDSLFVHSPVARLKPGVAAPDFILPGLDGKAVSLSGYRGKVVFLNVWATWCPPCREEMPSMERLYRTLKGEGFEILAVSVDAAGVVAVVPFMKKHNLSFPALLDPQGTIKTLYGVTGVPESFIIDKHGIVQKVIIGPMDWSTPGVVRFFRDLLQKP